MGKNQPRVSNSLPKFWWISYVKFWFFANLKISRAGVRKFEHAEIQKSSQVSNVLRSCRLKFDEILISGLKEGRYFWMLVTFELSTCETLKYAQIPLRFSTLQLTQISTLAHSRKSKLQFISRNKSRVITLLKGCG